MVSDRVDARVRGGVRGRIGLQLCDANTGRVVAAVERENYVAQRMLDVPAEFARLGIVGARNPNNNSANTWMANAGAFRVAPFTGLVVTDFDGEIDLNERGIGGAVTGYASKGVSGQGTQRGTYNAVESEHRIDYHRFAYDFATTEANGTIQSIYTGPWDAASTLVHGLPEARVPEALSHSGAAGNSSLELALDPTSGTVYRTVKQGVGGGQASLAVASLDTLLDQGAVSGEWATQTLPTGNFLAIAIVGPRMYWLDIVRGTGASRALSVYSAPLTDLQNHRLEHTWDAAFMNSIGWTANGNYLTGFAWMPDRETFVLGRSQSATGGPSAALYEFDPADNWALVRAFNNVGSLTIYNGLSALPGSPDEIMVSATICRLDNIAGEVIPQGELRSSSIGSSGSSSSSELSQGMGVVLDSGGGTASGRANFIPMQQFFSRARLDEPVVKTSTLTMKITYEFTMDPPVWMP